MYFINVIIALTTNLLYFIQSGVADSQIDCNNVRKKDFFLEINAITEPFMF